MPIRRAEKTRGARRPTEVPLHDDQSFGTPGTYVVLDVFISKRFDRFGHRFLSFVDGPDFEY